MILPAIPGSQLRHGRDKLRCLCVSRGVFSIARVWTVFAAHAVSRCARCGVVFALRERAAEEEGQRVVPLIGPCRLSGSIAATFWAQPMFSAFPLPDGHTAGTTEKGSGARPSASPRRKEGIEYEDIPIC